MKSSYDEERLITKNLDHYNLQNNEWSSGFDALPPAQKSEINLRLVYAPTPAINLKTTNL